MGTTYLGMRIRYLRKQDNITQSDLASAVGVGKSAVSMWENGVREPDFETLEAISDFFNVPIGTFFPSGTIEKPTVTSGNEQDLTPIEREVLSMLHRLTEDQQRSFLDYLKFLLSNQSP